MTAAIFGAACGGNQTNYSFYAVSGTGTGPNRNAISIDGINWTEVFPQGGVAPAGGNTSRARLFQNRWLGFDNGANVARDGSSSDRSSTGLTTTYSMAYGNGRYVAVGVRGGDFCASYAPSLNGPWTRVILAGGASASGSAIDFVNNLFIAISGDGYISTSVDGVTWTLRYSGAWPTNVSNSAIEYGNTHYVIRGRSNGEYLYSNDGFNWAPKIITGLTQGVKAIITWHGPWYAFDSSHVAITFTPQDANSWIVTPTTFDGVTTVYNVAADANRLVIFGTGSNSPKISYSIDGLNWTAANIASVLGTSPQNGDATVAYAR